MECTEDKNSKIQKIKGLHSVFTQSLNCYLSWGDYKIMMKCPLKNNSKGGLFNGFIWRIWWTKRQRL